MQQFFFVIFLQEFQSIINSVSDGVKIELIIHLYIKNQGLLKKVSEVIIIVHIPSFFCYDIFTFQAQRYFKQAANV